MIHIPGTKPLQRVAFIIRLEGVDNYTNIYRLKQQKPILTTRTLLHFQHQLPGFLRVSKSALVNPAYVVRVVKKGRTLHLRMSDDTLVLVSRRRVAETLEALSTLLKPEEDIT